MERPSDWFVRNLAADGRPHDLTDDHLRCLDALVAITTPSGLYNLPTPIKVTEAVSLWPHGAVSVLLNSELATYDSDALTRLVVMAHRLHVRVAVGAWHPHQDQERAELMAQAYRDSAEDYGYDTDMEWDDPALGTGCYELTVHPRKAESEHRFAKHPGLTDLRDHIDGIIEKENEHG